MTSLLPFQEEGIAWLRSRSRALLADEMGLGKRVQLIGALDATDRAVVVAPARALGHWLWEIKESAPHLRAVRARSRKCFVPEKPGDVILVSYDSLPDPTTLRAWFAGSADLGSVTLVLDSAHYVAHWKTDRSKKAAVLASLCRRVWLSEGAPLKPLELFTVLDVAGLRVEAFGSWDEFVMLFNGRKNRYGAWEFGPAHLTEIGRRLAPHRLRRTRAQAIEQSKAVG